MIRCAKCGKEIHVAYTTAYGVMLCGECHDDYLMTDEGKVEYLISIAVGECPMSDYDADFLGHVASCWRKYRDQFAMSAAEIQLVEATAIRMGLLDDEDELDSLYHDCSEAELRKMGCFDNLNEED